LREYLSEELGYQLPNQDFYARIEEWRQWYRGNVASFHPYRIYNGSAIVSMRRDTLNMAEKVCSDWANLLLNEKVFIHVDDEGTQAFVDEVLEDNNYWVCGNEAQEWKSALGTTAYLPYVVSEGERNIVRIDYVTAERILPLSWSNGKVEECAFASERTVDGQSYVYLQLHVKEGGTYRIYNKLFADEQGQITEVAINGVRGFEGVVPMVDTGSTRRQFVIDRLNIANYVDPGNPMGVAVFAGAIDALKGADLVYDSYNNEFLLGKKRIMVKPAAAKHADTGQPVFDSNDTTFYLLPSDPTDNDLIREINMDLRAQDHEVALQNRLNLISVKCGFGEGHYAFNQSAVKTATEVVSENSVLFRNLRKHEIILESVLTELTRIIVWLGKRFVDAGLDEEADVNIQFDDSVIESAEALRAQAQMEFQLGLIDQVEYFMRVNKLGEEEALALAAKISARKPPPEAPPPWSLGV